MGGIIMNAILRVRVGYNPDGTPIFKSIPAIKGDKGDKGDPGGNSVNTLNFGVEYDEVQNSINNYQFTLIKKDSDLYGYSGKKSDGTFIFSNVQPAEDFLSSTTNICSVDVNNVWNNYSYFTGPYVEGEGIDIDGSVISVVKASKEDVDDILS